MPNLNSHRDLFNNSDTLDKIKLFQTLLDSQNLTEMEALALVNTIHSELEQARGHEPAVYTRYAQMIEEFEHKMPDLHKEVVRKWSDLQYILKSRAAAEENEPEGLWAETEDLKSKRRENEPAETIQSDNSVSRVSNQSATRINKQFELEQEAEVGGAEEEQEEIEEEKEEQVEKEKESGEESEKEESKAPDSEEVEEKEESDKEEVEVEAEGGEEKEVEKEESVDEVEETAAEKEEAEEKREPAEAELEVEENERVEARAEGIEKEIQTGNESAEKEIVEEVDRQPEEAAEAAHVLGEIEPIEPEEEPPMEASG